MIIHNKDVICANCGGVGHYDFEPCYKSFMDTMEVKVSIAERTAKQCEKILKEQHDNNCVKIALLEDRIRTLERREFGCCGRTFK